MVSVKPLQNCLPHKGAEVFILELNKSTADETVKTIIAAGGKATAFAVNVSDQAQVKETISAIAQKAGRIDILVNSAGISHIGKLDNTLEEDFDRIVSGEYKGSVQCHAWSYSLHEATGWRCDSEFGFGCSKPWIVGSFCLFDEQRCSTFNDLVGSERLYKP